MTYSQKYALAYFLSPIKNGIQFNMANWPLHVTIADVFTINRPVSNIDAKLATLFSETKIIKTTALDVRILGITSVVVLDKTKELQRLHYDTVSLLQENGASFNNPEFTGSEFLPHSTIQKSGRLTTGDEINIDSVSLVDMFPGGDWQERKVLATFKLS